MKKIISLLLFSFAIVFSLLTDVNSQVLENGVVSTAIPRDSVVANEIKAINATPPETDKESVKKAKKELQVQKANLATLKAHSRAAENFKKSFKEQDSVKWIDEGNAIIAFFSRNQIPIRCVYNKNGILIHTLRSYSSDNTPEDIRAILDRDYPKAEIIALVQVNENNMQFYYAQLQDRCKYKTVVIYDGETALVKEFNKAN
jgi:hypothetical protein